jgi:hypothetical protein
MQHADAAFPRQALRLGRCMYFLSLFPYRFMSQSLQSLELVSDIQRQSGTGYYHPGARIDGVVADLPQYPLKNLCITGTSAVCRVAELL